MLFLNMISIYPYSSVIPVCLLKLKLMSYETKIALLQKGLYDKTLLNLI